MRAVTMLANYTLRGPAVPCVVIPNISTYMTDGLEQDCSNSNTLAMELLQSWT